MKPASAPAALGPARPEGGDSLNDHQFARTLANGIDLLLCFSPGEPSLANKDLAARTGLSRPTVARLTHTLCLLGYLRQDEMTARYRLGAAVLGISHPLLASMRIRPIARPLMETLARELGAAVSLGVRHRIHMVYVESVRGSEDFPRIPDIGAPLPMMATAMGRAWLAQAPPAERRSVLNQIRVAEPEQHQRQQADVLASQLEFEHEGFCSARADWRPDVHGFAVPLHAPVDNQRFVFNCGVLASRGSYASLRRHVAPRLVTLARTIEVLLGQP